MHKFDPLDNEISRGLDEINIIPSTLAEINQPGKPTQSLLCAQFVSAKEDSQFCVFLL
jgi:hypothetical protein